MSAAYVCPMTQFVIAIGLVQAACSANRAKLDRLQAFKAIRGSAQRHDLPVSNQAVRDAVGAVYGAVRAK